MFYHVFACVALQASKALNVHHIRRNIDEVTANFWGVRHWGRYGESSAVIMIWTIMTRLCHWSSGSSSSLCLQSWVVDAWDSFLSINKSGEIWVVSWNFLVAKILHCSMVVMSPSFLVRWRKKRESMVMAVALLMFRNSFVKEFRFLCWARQLVLAFMMRPSY